MSARPAAASSYVVRTPEGWWSTDVLDGSATRVGLSDVLVALGADPSTSPEPLAAPGQAPGGATVPDEDSWWRPTWMWVGQVDRGALVVEGDSDEPIRLDQRDVRLIDALDQPMRLGEISRRCGIPSGECSERLARLADGGRAVQPSAAPPPSVGHAPGVTASPEPIGEEARTDPAAGDLALRLGRVGRAVGRLVRRTPAAAPERDHRIPVYAVWHREAGPLLSLGMLTASARAHDGGALGEIFEIRRPETMESFLEDLALRGGGPAVLLCSDYVWSLERNLRAARRAATLTDQLVVLHGGPSCPKYEADAERFLVEHGDAADVLVRGEGEYVLPALLEVIAHSPAELCESRLAEIRGITFRRRNGEVVRTPDQERIADLDALPSPYLTGEFDDIHPDAWQYCLSIETTRGCPYGCTFCDWGSSTLSRIRKYSLDRVAAEVEWAASRGVNTINLADANFGIISRDVETARAIARVKARTGSPRDVAFYPAKNTTKHLAEIVDVLLAAGMTPAGSLSLQTSDPDSLAAVERSNISTDHYVRLAAEYRRRGLPLHGDLLVGIPGQTFDSFRRDLQFNLDHEIMSRTWQLQLLPNAPMNDPAHRERFQIRSDATGRVISTSTFSPEERDRMLRLRSIDIVFERYGVLRHLMRVLQWDHGIEATELMVRVLDLTDRDPLRYPLLTWIARFFERFPTTAVGWDAFYEEVGRFVEQELGLEVDAAIRTALRLQQFLMPHPGRSFPATIELEHDYVSYYRAATASLYGDGAASGPTRPLRDWPPAVFEVDGDPLGLCTDGMSYASQSEDPTMENDFVIGGSTAYELESELVRLLPFVAGNGIRARGPAVPVMVRQSL